MLFAIALCGLSLTACGDDDNLDTNQYKGGVSLNVYGPQPVARGGVLRFIGSNMDRVVAVVIPGCNEITDIEVVSTGEIRVVVPQTAEPGFVILKTAKGEIKTITQLTYSEPISIDEQGGLMPNPVRPGDVLTIKGDYLNLIKEIVFTNKLAVGEADFMAHSRKEIKVRVPEEAATGELTLADAPEADESAMRNLIVVKGLEVVLPSAEVKQDLTGHKPGDKITVKGKDLDLVRRVLMPNGEEVEFTYTPAAPATKADVEVGEGSEKIVFTLPENVSNGVIVMVPASGVQVAIANIGVAAPAEVKADPAEGLRAGDVLTLSGLNMELVTSVSFPGVADAVTEFAAQSATELKVALPEATVTGEVVLNTASGQTATVAIATQKPEFTGFASAELSLGSDVTIQGKNLDLVKKVIFTGGAEVEIDNAGATEFTFAMPTSGSETGKLTLVMGNGESVETAELTINAPEFCYITTLPAEGEEHKGGEVLVVPVANADKLTGVQVKSKDVQYILTPDGQLFISIPQMAGKKTSVKLISSNGTVEYFINFIPATEIENVVMGTMHDLGSWTGEAAGGAFRINKADLREAGFAVGAKLKFYTAAYAYTQIQLNNASWSAFDTYKFDAASCPKVLEIEVTQALYDHVMNADDGYSDTGIIIQGEGVVISKVAVWFKMKLEMTLWEGEAVADDWGNQPMLLTDGGQELKDAEAAVGQTLRFYFTPLDSDWKVQIMEGHWGPPYASVCAFGSDTEEGKFTEYDLAGNGGCVSLTITQEMLDAAYTVQWWGGVFLLNGDNMKCTKVTIE